jgi:hypothetical protein
VLCMYDNYNRVSTHNMKHNGRAAIRTDTMEPDSNRQIAALVTLVRIVCGL